MKHKLIQAAKYSVFLGLAAFLFYQAFKNTEFSILVEDFKKANYSYVILSMVMGYLAFISRGIRWNYLLEPLGKKAKTWNAIHAITVGYLANIALPRAGEIARCTALRSTDNIPLNRLIGTVALERIIDSLMLLLSIILAVALEFDKLQAFFQDAYARNSGDGSGLTLKVALAGSVLLFGVLLYLFRHRIMNLPGFSKVREFWHGFKEGFKSLKMVKNKAAFFGHTLFIWLMYYAMIYVVVFAMDSTSGMDPSSGLFIMVVGSFGMVIPAPGGIGSYHYLVMLAMGVLGISQADGVSFATLVHTGQLIMTVGTGLLATSIVYRERKKLKRNDL